MGVTRMVAAIAYGKGELWPASVVLAGEYGIEGVSLGVPVSLGRRGVEEIHEWDITPEEHAALHESAASVREATNTLRDMVTDDGKLSC
jgi:malate dehydrogenase